MANKRSMKGCLFGCLGVAVAILLFFAFTSYWLLKKGKYQVPEALLFPETDFYVHTELKRENEQMVEFFVTQMRNMNDEQMSHIQSSIPFFTQDFKDKKARKDVEKLLPLQVEVSGDLANEDVVIAVGFSIYNNMARIGFWFLKRSAKKNSEGIYREVNGKTYLKPNPSDDYFLALENSVFYMAKTEEAMKRALNPGDEAVSREEFHPLLGQVNQQAMVWGVARGESLAHMLRAMHGEGAEPLMRSESGVLIGGSEFRAMAFDAEPVSKESLRIRLYCDVVPADDSAQQALGAYLDRRFEKVGVTVAREMETTHDGLLVTLTLSDLEHLSIKEN